MGAAAGVVVVPAAGHWQPRLPIPKTAPPGGEASPEAASRSAAAAPAAPEAGAAAPAASEASAVLATVPTAAPGLCVVVASAAVPAQVAEDVVSFLPPPTASLRQLFR